MADIKYILVQPDKIVKSGSAWGVVLPTGEINQTVISGHTPSIIKIDNGVIKILDEKGAITEDYFISEGVANILNDECIVACENIIARNDITLETALSYDDEFHQLVAENIKASKPQK